MNKPQYPTLALRGVNGNPFMSDAAIKSGMTFLTGELEKLDPKLHEPLTSTTWPRDIPVRTGGGFVETVSSFNVSYATAGGENDGVIAGQTNHLPIIQADLGKDIYRVFNWGQILKVPFIDSQKLQNIGRSLEDMYDKGIRLNHDKTLDKSVYVGFAEHGSHGLVNHPDILAGSALTNAAGASTKWADKTIDEILLDVNKIMNDTWEASEFDLSGMANHILLPPEHYARLVSEKVSEAGNISALNYLLDNNIGRNQGVDLFIGPSRWCIGAGVGGSDRMVGYANDEDRVRFDITVPLGRVMTQASATELAYLTPYIAQFSEVQFLYLTPARYVDGI